MGDSQESENEEENPQDHEKQDQAELMEKSSLSLKQK